MRHLLRRIRNLGDVFARRLPHPLARIEHPALASNQRLRQQRGIVDHRHDREELAVLHPMLGERAVRRRRQAVAPQVARLQVRGRDREHVALPCARREPLPRVRRFGRRVRAAVEPNRSLHALEADPRMKREKPLRRGIDLGVDPERRQPAHRVVAAVLAALVFRDDRDPVRVVAVAAQTRRFVHRDARVIAELGARQPLGAVLVIERHPGAREVDVLGRGARGHTRGRQRHRPGRGPDRARAPPIPHYAPHGDDPFEVESVELVSTNRAPARRHRARGAPNRGRARANRRRRR